MKPAKYILAFLTCISATTTALPQRYSIGDIVQDFTLTDRDTGQEVNLSDFEGKVIFLEWFAYWCPYCQAAAEQTKSGIVDYYASLGGNANKVPVIHLSLNLEPNNPEQTTAFINRYGLGLVLNDYQMEVSSRFQPGGQPIFAIINGVKNSTSHQQWELLYSRLGIGELTHPIAEFRQAIDSVQAAPNIAPPTISSHPNNTRIATGSPLELSVQASGTDLSYQWKKDDAPLSGQTASTFSIASPTLNDAGSYTVTVGNAGGELTSAPAQVDIVLSLADYLEAAGLSELDREANADPDHDGYANAFEYLAQTDPNDRQDIPSAILQYIKVDGVPTIRIQFTTSADTLGVNLAAQFLAYPSTAGNTIQTITLGQDTEIHKAIPANAKTFLARLVATQSANE